MPLRRVRIEIQGVVQGVGFRPFVYRLARELALRGWVVNDARGVRIEAEGPARALHRLLTRLPAEAPPRAVIHSLHSEWLEPAGNPPFEIRHSPQGGPKAAVVQADLAVCGACLAETLDAADRRHGYPFTNCTACGPRFSIIEALPYDRPNTTMRRFAMCPRCRAEYDDPANRRFHAQPNACPACGPHLTLWSPDGRTLAREGAALRDACGALLDGRVVAVKGLGGFHLMADARNERAVARLRGSKRRRDKPFALMAPDLDGARRICHLSDREAGLLSSPESPIVLAARRDGARIAPNVAPGVSTLGVMLPSTPLHHLLVRAAAAPLVATSGNLSDEPICIDEREALSRLGGIADLFLVHDRPIARHVDDSIVRVMGDGPVLLRRARGWAPLPVTTRVALPAVLAVGAHLKSAVALATGRRVFISQHIGDLETPEAFAAFTQVIADFLRMYEARPVAIAHDLHPDYVSTRWAREAASGLGARDLGLAGARLVPVQHHHAHLAACLADAGAAGPALGVTWDGTGYGPDGTVWGGEFLTGDAAGFARVASLTPFRLPGGEAAIREPWRVALALIWETEGETAFGRGDLAPVKARRPTDLETIARMLSRRVNAPETTSAGRLFDGVAALIGLPQEVTFEGQAAMALESIADPAIVDAYPMPLNDGRLDWRPAVVAVLDQLRAGAPREAIASRFHNTLADGIVEVARRAGQARVALTGGCFQNRLLLERAARRLADEGFEVLRHRQVPPNDGGISLGQVVVAAAQIASGGPTA